jgi:hypothetical protein
LKTLRDAIKRLVQTSKKEITSKTNASVQTAL